MKRAINVPEILGASCILLLGITIIVVGSDYGMGSLSRMGSGYFPVILGCAMVLLALALLFEVWRLPRDAQQTHSSWRPMLMVSLGVASFGALVESAGLVPATCALVVLSSLAESPVRPITILVSAVSMSVLGVILFIRLLGLPLTALGG